MKGGLMVDGGRSHSTQYPPLLARLNLPDDWVVLVVIPNLEQGLSGIREQRAFAQLPDIPIERINLLCRLVLLELLPAVAEANLKAFGEALSRVQTNVGECFAPAQGGVFADPQLYEIIELMTELGLVGAGQSSWGPTVYGFMQADPERQKTIRQELLGRFPIDPTRLYWTHVSNTGAILTD